MNGPKYEARLTVERWARDVSMQPPETAHLAWQRIADELADLMYDLLEEREEGERW